MAKHLNTAEFDVAVKAAPVAMVDFWAEWCGPCKMLAPAIEDLAKQYEGRALVAKVNVDEEYDLRKRFGIMGIPTLIVFKNGKMVNKVSGLQNFDDLCSLVKD